AYIPPPSHQKFIDMMIKLTHIKISLSSFAFKAQRLKKVLVKKKKAKISPSKKLRIEGKICETSVRAAKL
ncbi:hypothetical protein, partial [uncultured Helicobacter sp.]|uniref:hypothetical protein n=1 Tax=uncultured Helicobacter sp. TaxID=175537 RepID=UPI0026176728